MWIKDVGRLDKSTISSKRLYNKKEHLNQEGQIVNLQAN